MSNKRMVPEVRFKGFEEDWKKLQFSELLNYERPDKYIVTSEKYNEFYKTPVLTANKGFILGFTNETNTYNKSCILFDDFTLDSKYVNFPFMVKSSALKILTAKDNCNDYFTYSVINATSFELQGHARHYIEFVQPVKTLVPSYQEQSKIGEFFKNIDNLITQTSTKLDKLKDVKKSLLNKMFPKEGKLVPEIRFSQFNDLWKVVKLNEISRYTISNLNVSDANYNGKYALYDALCKIGYTDKMAINKPYITIIKDGAGIGRVRVLPENTMFIGTMGAIHNNQEVNINFLYHIMSKFDFSISSIGTAIPHIYWSDYSENLVKISELVEQSKIAEFLTAVDKLITLQNKKLTKLKDIKKALLQKMFV